MNEMKAKKICFIPVRKGSKGIPGKNKRMLCGKPLVCWVTDTIIDSGIGDEIWIATDSDEMEDMIYRHYGNRVHVFRRNEAGALDTSPTMDVVREFIDKNPLAPENWFILLQATSPFTTIEDLKKLEFMLDEGKYDSAIACLRLKKFRWSEEGYPLDYNWETKPRRQEYKGFLIESGAFYASTVSQIKHSHQLISGQVGIIEVDESAFIDIDEESDWVMAEAYMNYCLKK